MRQRAPPLHGDLHVGTDETNRGGALFALLPALEFAPLVAVWIGADEVAAQTALSRWFLPILLAGSAVFGAGAVAFAMAIARARILTPATTAVVVSALVVMAAMRFVPRGAALYVGGTAGLVALWPLAAAMWRYPVPRRRPTATAVSEPISPELTRAGAGR